MQSDFSATASLQVEPPTGTIEVDGSIFVTGGLSGSIGPLSASPNFDILDLSTVLLKVRLSMNFCLKLLQW